MGIWSLIIRNYALSIYPPEYWALLHSPIPIRQIYSPPFRGVHRLPSHNRPKPSVATAKLRFPPQRPPRGVWGSGWPWSSPWNLHRMQKVRSNGVFLVEAATLPISRWGSYHFMLLFWIPGKKRTTAKNNWFFRQENIKLNIHPKHHPLDPTGSNKGCLPK